MAGIRVKGRDKQLTIIPKCKKEVGEVIGSLPRLGFNVMGLALARMMVREIRSRILRSGK